jgi:hypothetical protein
MNAALIQTGMTSANKSASFFNKESRHHFFHPHLNEPSFFTKTSNLTPPIQPKLNVGQPNDIYEKEADAMADKVVQKLSKPNSIQTKSDSQNTTITPFIQKKCAHCEEEEKLQKKEAQDKFQLNGSLQKNPIFESNVQRKCAECEREEELQKKGDGSSQNSSANIESRLNSSKGSGSPLPKRTLEQMESSFGVNFSNVRVHNDSSAIEMSRDLNAQAFTHGSDFYFNSGKFDASSSKGHHLLAHELTHVVQQKGGGITIKNKEAPLIQSRLHTDIQNYVQRVHIEGGRKKFDCSDFSGDLKLEDCLNDADRLRPFETGASVIKVQIGLQRDGMDLGADGTSGVYGADTGKAVQAFKQKHNLGFTQFPDVGPGTMGKLDELCATKPTPQPPKPKSSPPEVPGKCGPGTANPFCLPIPSPDAPCQPIPDVNSAEILRNNMSIAVPLGAAADTVCSEVKPVWEAYFAATSQPFSFSDNSSCVVNAAKTDQDASKEANRIARGHLVDILDNLPNTLQGVIPSPFPFPGRPIAKRRMPLRDAILPKLRGFLHHEITYNDKHNAAANIAGGTGVNGQGSDIFGDDDRLFGGTVIIEVNSIDPTSGEMIGQVRWQPHIHVKDTVDFCPGNLTNSVILREFTVPMSKLEAMGLTRDVPITIDYDLDVQQSNFSVLPLIGPLPESPD